MRRYQPDVLVLQWWTSFWAPVWFVLGLLNRIFLQKPLVYICHNVLPHEMRWWDPWLARMALQWGTRFIVQSEEEQKRLAALVIGAQVDIIPHPVYEMFADQKIPKDEARRQLGLPSDALILLFFGMIREYKGLKDLIAAMPEIQMHLGKVILLVAGEFWEDKRPYLELIERLGIGDSVIIEDRYIPNEEVGLYFSASDALAIPYKQMTGSGVVGIAQCYGLPIIRLTSNYADHKPKSSTRIEEFVMLVTSFFTQSKVQVDLSSNKGVSWSHLINKIVEKGA
ncbi:MAG: glycosyltransferase [Anaerolineae bacterium]|nr:glycosyltransferase [Anaerolineae bacterium]